jgi:hypothetical protein
MQDLIADIRFGARLLVKSPSFTLVTLLTLALCIGANTAMFTLVNGILFRPLPFPVPTDWVSVQGSPELPPALVPSVFIDAVSTDYFRTLGMSVVEGRNFTDQDSHVKPVSPVILN